MLSIELRPLNAVGKAGEILDQRGDGELAAGLMAVDDQRMQVGASRINAPPSAPSSRSR